MMIPPPIPPPLVAMACVSKTGNNTDAQNKAMIIRDFMTPSFLDKSNNAQHDAILP